MERPPIRRTGNRLQKRIPLRLYLSTFFLFGTLGILLDIAMVTPRPWYGVGLMVVMTGLIAVGWVHAFQHGLRLILFLVPASIVVPILVDVLIPSQSLNFAMRRGGLDPRLLGEVVICLAMFVAGYVLFVRYIRDEGLRHLRLQTEMDLARRIHDTLVTPIAVSTPRVEFFGRSTASSEMGGDLVDLVETAEGHTAVVADVSGHGVAAGVLMAMVKAALRMRLREGGPLDALVRDLNRLVHELTEPQTFVTFSCLRVDGGTHVHYALAGHLPILHFERATRTLHRLPNEHLPLGVLAEEAFAARTVTPGTGDLLVMLTDGFMETMNARGQLLGEERLESLIVQHADRPLVDIYSALTALADAHGPAGDDRTVLLARWR